MELYDSDEALSFVVQYHGNSYDNGAAPQFAFIKRDDARKIVDYARGLSDSAAGVVDAEIYADVQLQLDELTTAICLDQTDYVAVEHLHPLCNNILYLKQENDERGGRSQVSREKAEALP